MDEKELNGQVETSTQEEPIVKEEVVEEVVNETIDETKNDIPKFETIEDYNKFVQSTSSKAKGELLKEIGFDKVVDIKEAIEKGKSNAEIMSELDLTKNELATIKAELETKNNELETKKNNELLAKVGVSVEYGNLFLQLVKADTSDDDLETKALKVKETIAKMVGVTPKIGSEKTPAASQEDIFNKTMKDLQKL